MSLIQDSVSCRLSPQQPCGNPCICAPDERLHLSNSNEPSFKFCARCIDHNVLMNQLHLYSYKLMKQDSLRSSFFCKD